MLFGRRRRIPTTDRHGAPSGPRSRHGFVILADLHVDFTGSGAMAAEGSAEVAVQLADLARQLLAAWNAREEGARALCVAVEGGQWGRHAPLPAGSPYPPHCDGSAQSDLAAALALPPRHCYVWETCPTGPGDVLSATADAKGQLISLERSLRGSPARVDVAGLSAEHSALALAEALAARLDPLETEICFWPDLCTFLEPESAQTRLARLQQAGVTVRAGYGIGRP